MGYEIKTFEAGRLPPAHEVTPRTPIKGSTRSVRLLFERLFPGVLYPNIDVPPELAKYARRKITPTTLGAVRAIGPVRHSLKFIKPHHKAKLFRGIDLAFAADYTSHLPDRTTVLLQDYREFRISERYLVTPREGAVPVQSCCCEHAGFAEKLRLAWGRAAPASYVLDVALSSKPRQGRELPTLVEINSVLTAGSLYSHSERKPLLLLGGAVVAAWESYARYGETGSFQGRKGGG